MARDCLESTGPDRMQRVYYETRFPALSLALALTLNEDAACAASLSAHAAVFSGRQGDIEPAVVLRRILRKTRLRAGTAADASLSGLGKRARAAWALVRVAGMSPDAAGAALGEPAQRPLAEADGVLGAEHAEAFRRRVSARMEKKEIWNDILFRAGKKRALSARFARAAAVAGVAAALFLLGREGYALFRALGGNGARTPDVATMRAADPAFFRRVPERPSAELPRVNQPLMDALAEKNDAQRVRVSFRFYDAQAMRGIKSQGETLEDIYAKLYEETFERGRVNALAAAAANEYYANYIRPFLPQERASDFKSEYASVYEAAQAIATSGGYARTAAAHPEIFASREAFDAFLYSPAFLSRAPALAPLLRLQPRMDAGEDAAQPELRAAYEEALFAFFNPGGSGGVAVTEPFPFDAGELRAFFARREEMGRRLHEQNAAACAKAMPPDSEVTSDVLEGTDSGLFSATLTKPDVLRLAREDGRFFFLGLTAPRDGRFAGRAEAELLALAREGLARRFDVYLINEEYLLYSLNYAAPLNLPQGFIDDIRARLNCEDTQFEMEAQYVFRMRYAHPQSRTGYGILRALVLTGDAFFTTRDFKPFSLMARY